MLYTLVFNGDEYRLMLWDKEQIASVVGNDDINHLIDINGAPVRHKDVFKEPLRVSFAPVYPGDVALKIPDLCVLEGRLYLSAQAYEVLGEILKEDGEFLDVIEERGERGFVYTPLRVAEDLEAIDWSCSKPNDWNYFDHLAFHEERVRGWSVFRMKHDGYMSLFCQPAVKDAIEKTKLTGVYITSDLANIFPQAPGAAAPLN
jgi:hypothetical protein